jgi:V/A-type H+-transporting ATPase subunit K
MADVSGLTGGLSTGAGAALGAGIAIAVSALAAAWSQGTLGSSAIGAAAERPEFEKNIIVYIAIPETIVLFGFVIAFMLIGKIAGE